MHDRKFCKPYLLSEETLRPLQPDAEGNRLRSEKWYQDLIFKNPQLLPVDELEPAFTGSVALAREMVVGRGRVDVTCINSQGLITLIETKLFRNPDARRSVVSQIIEYATGMAKWSYADLCEHVRRARASGHGGVTSNNAEGRNADPILPLLKEGDAFNEARFIDSVTKNLQKGRFLLLIAGDGIQEGVEQLTEVLQQSPHLDFALALVELEIYQIPDRASELLIQPRVLVRTRAIDRHRITINVQNALATIAVDTPVHESDEVGTTITETIYFERVEQESGPELAGFVRWIRTKVAETPELGVTFSKKGMALWWKHGLDVPSTTLLRLDSPSAKLLRLCTTGQVIATQGVAEFCRKNGLPDSVSADYQNGLINLFGSAKRSNHGSRGNLVVKMVDGSFPPMAPLAAKRDEFWQLILATAFTLSAAMNEKVRQSPSS